MGASSLVSPRVRMRHRLVLRRLWSDAVTRYTKDHEWVRFVPGNPEVTLGITNYAQEALGDVVFVDLPSIGAEFKREDVVAAVESVKAASDVLMPSDGKV